MTDEIQQQGFCILPELFSAGDLKATAEFFAQSKLKRSRAGVRHALQHQLVKEIAREDKLMDMARRVLGPAAVPFHATLFEKTPTANWLVVWHQDTALPLTDRTEKNGWGPWSLKEGLTYAHAPASALSKVLALRVHFDDSTAENGPLRVLPGTHKRGIFTDDELRKLSKDIAPVDCLVPRGGVIAMCPLIVHASSKSLNDTPRRVLHIEYATSIDIEEDIKLAIA